MSLLAFGAVIICLFSSFSTSREVINNRPIIGVLAQESYKGYLHYGSSAIVASYVKFLESAGARVVPVMIYKSQAYYEDVLSKLNGVLFPGGGDHLKSSGYGRTGRIIYDIAVKLNDKGDYFPLWGTCLGFELLTYVTANKLWLTACAAEDVATNINFVRGYNTSRLFQNMDKSLYNIMQKNKVTANYHQWCMTSQNFTLSGLDKFYKVLATSNDSKNLSQIAVIEAYKYPFYGVVFHPEKVLFEWVNFKNDLNIPHTFEAIQVAQYFANFFVNEAKKSKHRFPNKKSEDEALIYNYNPVFLGKINSSVVQEYFFP